MALMTRVLYPAGLIFTAVNIAGVGFASGLGEGAHAATHVVLAGAGAWFTHRLHRRSGTEQAALGARDREERLEALAADLEMQRRELAEAQERLDFAERLLTQAADTRRQGAET